MASLEKQYNTRIKLAHETVPVNTRMVSRLVDLFVILKLEINYGICI